MGERSKGQVVAYVAAAVLVAVVAVRQLGGGGEEPPPPPISIDEGTGGGSDTAGEPRLYVHVAGAVREAGLYRLPAGTRVGAAIERAGGTTPKADLAGVNLAAELQDGQQVIVPRRGEGVSVAAPASSAADDETAAPVSLSQATPEELDASVEGIGPVLAQRIVEFRDERGGVSSIDELQEVDGIGESRVEALREALVP